MSQSVDLNYKIWGWKARNHIMLYYAIDLLISACSLLAVIDYMNLPSNPPSGVKSMVWGYIILLPLSLVVMGCFICLIFSFNNRIFYGVVSILFFIFFTAGIFYGLLGVVLAPLVFGSKNSKNLERKYYKIAWTVNYFEHCALPFVRIYLAIILLKLSFLYPTQRVVVVVAQPVPAQKQRKEVSEGDSGPTKTGNSGNSGNSGAE
ncbi:unnamed protein product [Caenorhabditis brenneri]